jgi:hypothetical protein
MAQATRALSLYEDAKRAINAAGFGWEPEWQRSRALARPTERDFLRETAWVVLCSGFKEKVVRDVFDYISLCFCDWEAASEIATRRDACIRTAFGRFRNERKLLALADIAALVDQTGFDVLYERLQRDPVSQLQIFPFIGPVTSWHLAKNLGFNVAKNDRHLARLAVDLGYANAHDLCHVIARKTGELECVVDVVLWRFATLRSNTQLVLPIF